MLQFLAVVGGGNVIDQRFYGASVEHKVMHVEEEKLFFANSHELRTEKAVMLQVKGPHKGGSRCFQALGSRTLRLRHEVFGNHAGQAVGSLTDLYAQSFMHFKGGLHGGGKAVKVNSCRQLTAHGEVVHHRFRLPHTFEIDTHLRLCERVAGFKPGMMLHRICHLRAVKQRGDAPRRSSAQDQARRESVQFRCLNECEHLDGVTAEAEKVVIDADAPAAEQLLHAPAEYRLRLVFRGSVFALVFADIRRQKCLSVKLAVCVDRHRVKLLIIARDHVVGQQALQGRREPGCGDGHRSCIECHQILLAHAVVEGLNGSVCHAVDFLQQVFDLLRLDALTIDLDHPVHAVEIDEVAVFVKNTDIAGMEKDGAVRLPDKGSRSCFGHVQISVGKMPLQTDFSLRALWDRIPVLVQQADCHSLQGFSDGGVVVLFVDTEGTDAAQRLAQAIGIADFKILAVNTAEPLTADKHALHSPASLVEPEQLGRNERGTDLVLIKVFLQAADIPAPGVTEDMDSSAAAEHAEIFEDKGHKGHGRACPETHIADSGKQAGVSLNRLLQRAAGMQDALGLTRGAGGVDYQCRGRIRDRCGLHRLILLYVRQKNLIQQQRRAAVLPDVRDALRRIAADDGNCGTACFQRAEIGRDVFHRAVQPQNSKASLPETGGCKFCGDAPAESIQFGVGCGTLAVPVDDCRLRRVLLCK